MSMIARQAPASLKVTWFDRVTSLLMAIILLIGCCVTVLFIVWMLRDEESVVVHPKPELVLTSAGSSAQGETLEFEVPSTKEVAAMIQPSLHRVLQQVSDEAIATAAEIDSLEPDRGIDGQNENDGTLQGIGHGRRDAGPDPGFESIPRFERWELRFQASGPQDYASQLDFFGIELGVVGGGIDGVDVVGGFTSAKKDVRRLGTDRPKRLYFVWMRESPLAAYERDFLRSAKVQIFGRQIVKYIPKSLENDLASAELEYARRSGNRSVEEIAKTVFQCQPGDQQYSIVVLSQRYRKAR